MKVERLADFRRRALRQRRAVLEPRVVDHARSAIAAVRRRGDAAVLEEVRRFDFAGARARDLWAGRRDLRAAARACPSELRRAIDRSYADLVAAHRAQRPRPIVHRGRAFRVELAPEPLERVGGCVPRGTVGYPSTALMVGAPAAVAGVGELVIASPMPRDGSLDPVLSYAAVVAGATGVYRAGGAAAVAALAYGTDLCPRVDAIVGPGNAYTTAAKWLVSADVGIDSLAGPSELVVVASADADPAAIALDLEAQAEHGGGPYAALISDSATLLRTVAKAIDAIGAPRGTIGLYRAPSLALAVAAAAEAAPEHLSLSGRAAERLAPRTRRAGAVFVGSRTAVAFGDYVAGSNHVLPTGGTARWASALRVEDMIRWTTRVRATAPLRAAAYWGAEVARYEGMRFHAASMDLRG
ncbi:MAG: histidinol dehydrogenase [Chloroflexota bacterium]|nr:histidinol dehydrogenase [Chloroflexota bacterium]